MTYPGRMPSRAPSRCGQPGCGNIATKRGRCADHQPPPWEGRPSSTERYGISGSAQQTLHQRVLREEDFECYICGLPGADTCDHVIPIWKGGAKTDRRNLRAIHQVPCHEVKTKRENAERAAMRAEKRRRLREAAGL